MSQFIALLTLQDFAGIITLTVALLVVAIVIFLIVTSDKSEDKSTVEHKTHKARKGLYFFGLILLLGIISFVSLRLLPYPHFQKKADEVVTVVGIQWDWQMAHGVTSKTTHEFSGKNEISLPVNKIIKFIVTSDDVTHNFSIYNDKGVLLTQTQAMPQYKNELEYSFTQKGVYFILCLEYCGLAHPFMTGTIHIR